MGESNEVREIIERVVSASLAAHVTALKQELVDAACEQLQQTTAAPPVAPAAGGSIDVLNGAINSVREAFTQVEILGSLLASMMHFAERAALFVVRAGAGTGWRAVGMEHPEGIKAITLDLSSGLVSRAFHDRVPAAGSASEFDPQFVSTYGAPADGGNALVLPLAVRDKVAALVYADAGVHSGGKLDPSALEALVQCTGMWLEIVAARKSGASVATDSDTHIPKYSEPAPSTEATQPAYVESAATQTMPPPVSAPEPAYAPAMVAAAGAPASTMTATSAPETATTLSPEEEEVHKKARRFAKLLVDEIKLYNQAKVVEGRAHRDLYERLKDDIDKSRATYDRRYGATSATSGNYFTQELIRVLANDDPSLLGGSFSG